MRVPPQLRLVLLGSWLLLHTSRLGRVPPLGRPSSRRRSATARTASATASPDPPTTAPVRTSSSVFDSSARALLARAVAVRVVVGALSALRRRARPARLLGHSRLFARKESRHQGRSGDPRCTTARPPAPRPPLPGACRAADRSRHRCPCRPRARCSSRPPGRRRTSPRGRGSEPGPPSFRASSRSHRSSNPCC